MALVQVSDEFPHVPVAFPGGRIDGAGDYGIHFITAPDQGGRHGELRLQGSGAGEQDVKRQSQGVDIHARRECGFRSGDPFRGGEVPHVHRRLGGVNVDGKQQCVSAVGTYGDLLGRDASMKDSLPVQSQQAFRQVADDGERRLGLDLRNFFHIRQARIW